MPEAKDYQLVYDLDLAKLGADITYDVDNRGKIQQPFDRIAYFLELQDADGEHAVSCMSPWMRLPMRWTRSACRRSESGARFQQNVGNMNVYSNVKGIVAGTGLAGGNIEFWPNNYGPANAANVPNASGQVVTSAISRRIPRMATARCRSTTTTPSRRSFAMNHWREGGRADIGIGNQPTGNPDWTFAANAGSYKAKRLRVLVEVLLTSGSRAAEGPGRGSSARVGV